LLAALLLSPFSIQTFILLCLGNNDIRDRRSMTTFQLTKRDRPSSFPKSDRTPHPQKAIALGVPIPSNGSFQV
jgi:hypothetical protein